MVERPCKSDGTWGKGLYSNCKSLSLADFREKRAQFLLKAETTTVQVAVFVARISSMSLNMFCVLFYSLQEVL